MSLKLIVNERRRGVSPIPPFSSFYLDNYLTTGLRALEKLGWRLVCMRRRAYHPVNLILIDPQERFFGLLYGEGRFKVGSEIKIRDPHLLVEKKQA